VRISLKKSSKRGTNLPSVLITASDDRDTALADIFKKTINDSRIKKDDPLVTAK